MEQLRVKNYFIDLVFSVHELEIEIYENGHLDRCKIEEEKREKVIKKAGFKIIRSSPDKEDFQVFDEISRIENFIIESTKKITKQST